MVAEALEAVGLTAAMSSALAETGISCKALPDTSIHLLVPVARAHDALVVLRALQQSVTIDGAPQ